MKIQQTNIQLFIKIVHPAKNLTHVTFYLQPVTTGYQHPLVLFSKRVFLKRLYMSLAMLTSVFISFIHFNPE